ncbi:hypothetical protein POSPLADRAFT_1039511 [Postia placenta MAD-698-R-SB12]|uniref:Uncharacterized protein n=1 Tax=Postia placenta MAD-698-R-SB12 TaxID=670580 RepID=A0A1X6N430_9APHY|nr:hypothetical protein POSPLADRAFT_1039511 [Postia placenta MAD-698-R-SB12]OSX63368.1 hypothetical protein POSPLADRAFT_1039511 [Postia placenta MAD-698-R-SB12]
MTFTATSYVGTVHGMMKALQRVALQRPHIIRTSWERATTCDHDSDRQQRVTKVLVTRST